MKPLLLTILICLFSLMILLNGCAALSKKSLSLLKKEDEVTPLMREQEAKMEAFSYNVGKIGNGMSPQQVKDIMGEPDYTDKEADIYIKNQDNVWTYEHPVIASAKFIVIFRNNRVVLSTMVVTSVDGETNYLTREQFGIE